MSPESSALPRTVPAPVGAVLSRLPAYPGSLLLVAALNLALARHGIAPDRHYQLQQYGVKKRAHEDFDPVQATLVLEQVEADQQAQPLARAHEAAHG